MANSKSSGKPKSRRSKPAKSAEENAPGQGNFVPMVMEKTVIAMPLFKEFERKNEEKAEREKKTKQKEPEPVYPIIIDVNLRYHAGRQNAKRRVGVLIAGIIGQGSPDEGINPVKSRYSKQYVFAVLKEESIKELVRRDAGRGIEVGSEEECGAIYHIWPDFEIQRLTTKSVSTVKADAARNAFSAYGEEICWAVMDSGIDGTHPHFVAHRNLQLSFPPDPDGNAVSSSADPLQHRDFTVLSSEFSPDDDLSKDISFKVGENERPLLDEFGHGTHVAGIIAGELKVAEGYTIKAVTSFRDENGVIQKKEIEIKPGISGVAPRCKMVSLKVLDKDGRGQASNLIAAIEWIQEINGNGRHIRIHGVNMSVGYEFEPEWFACGQSPLCVEVDRLVKSGVVVVVAAGNTGFGWVQSQGKRAAVTAGLDLTINDPGNADLAITVGSTHRDMPHIYGVSYFSSKGPTGDGRLKPDLVAPGEKILSCDSAQRQAKTATPPSGQAPTVGETPPGGEASAPKLGYYREESGTSMAAPHVSGVIAAFLSVRREFIGKPEAVKEIFLSTATDLKRERYFQGSGLVDLMRAIQSV